MSDGVTVAVRGAGGRIQPVGNAERARRVRDAGRARWQCAGTDLERLSAADDFLAGAARAALRAGLDVSPEVRHAIRALWSAGEALTRRLAEADSDA